MDLGALFPNPTLLAFAVVLDLVLGDPQYRLHPIRLMGATVTWLERGLRGIGLHGYGGGVGLGLATALLWCAVTSVAVAVAWRFNAYAGMALHVLLIYSFLALRDLLDHVWAVEQAARSGDFAAARFATSRFVARDTGNLDVPACRRAGIESLSENLTDGYVSPLFWYAVLGLPGLVLFKVFSTLDSMVGNKSERYLRFGWFSARTDDVLNWIPARLTWLLIAAVALVFPRCSGTRALVVGWKQHAVVPGPNSGWSEAATAGAIQRRLVGPIVQNGKLVTDIWLGDAHVPAAGLSDRDVPVAMGMVTATALLAAAIAVAAIALYFGWRPQ